MQNRKTIATVAFVVVVGGVVALFIALSNLGVHPPDMPSHSGPHVLRFNLKNELIGTEADPPLDPLAAASSPAGFKYDERAAAEKINHGCEACHATCSEGQVTAAGQPPCRGEHHPPKTECIKCHRMGPR